MSEIMLLAYPFALIAFLMLAARWQPKSTPAPLDEQERGGQRR